MIDFTNAPTFKKGYQGANGQKIAIEYKGERYMLKFPAPAKQNENLSYAFSSVSEYLGCHIFAALGVPVQETLLGTYNVNGKEKIVVACKDFTSPGIVFQDFGSIKNRVVDSERCGYGTELEEVLSTLEEQDAVSVDEIKERFWDMFIVDAYIGNWDRHNGNWGFLYDEINDKMTLAPVFDCGSSLYPQADSEIRRKVLTDQKELDVRVFVRPTSALAINNHRINYFDFISSLENEDCNAALARIVPRINEEVIESIIRETPFISDLDKTFFITALGARKERILDFSLQKLQERGMVYSIDREQPTLDSVRNRLAAASSEQPVNEEPHIDRNLDSR
jgi:hypothetical protein